MRLAVIPARGGSKRIPLKNIKLFNGRPIISYSIEAALESNVFDKVIVSTDDAGIAKVANKWGAKTPFVRPEEISNDFASTNAVTAHAVSWAQKEYGDISVACCIYATSPFLQGIMLQQGLEVFTSNDCDFVMSVTSFDFPIQRAVLLDDENRVEPYFKEYFSKRSQDLVPTYHDAGQFYFGKASAFESSELYSKKTIGFVLPPYMVQDIDTEEDWKNAELKYKAFINGKL